MTALMRPALGSSVGGECKASGVSALPMFSAVALAIASAIQAAIAVSQIRDHDQEVIRHWQARDQLRTEIPWIRPRARWRRRSEVRALIDQVETLEFRRRFWRVRWSLASWVILLIGSVYGVIAAAIR